MSFACWQVSMTQYGFDVPYSKKPADAIRRSLIFDILSPYRFATYSKSIQEM